MMFRYHKPFFFRLSYLPFTSNPCADSLSIHHISLIYPIMDNGMYLVTIPYICFIMPIKLLSLCLLISQSSRYSLCVKFNCQSFCTFSICQFPKNTPYRDCCTFINFHSFTIRRFLVAIHHTTCVILSPFHTGCNPAFYLFRQISAVHFINKIFESYIHSTCLSEKIFTVKPIIDTNKADTQKRKYLFQIISNLQIISSKT